MKTISGNIKTVSIIFPALLLIFSEASAQYVKSPASLTKTFNSGVNWVDIDLDGDLDVAISGDDLVLAQGRGNCTLTTVVQLHF